MICVWYNIDLKIVQRKILRKLQVKAFQMFLESANLEVGNILTSDLTLQARKTNVFLHLFGNLSFCSRVSTKKPFSVWPICENLKSSSSFPLKVLNRQNRQKKLTPNIFNLNSGPFCLSLENKDNVS